MTVNDWTVPTTKSEPVDTKKHAQFFAAVRARGILNSMLDGPALAYEKQNPGFRARWEYNPPGGDKMMIVAREGIGFHIVDAKELGEKTESEQKYGPIKVGDLILMAAPEHIVAAIEMEDARAAYEDFKLPVQAYKDHIRGIKAKLHDGTLKETEPTGDVRLHQEVVTAGPGAGLDHEVERE